MLPAKFVCKLLDFLIHFMTLLVFYMEIIRFISARIIYLYLYLSETLMQINLVLLSIEYV